MTSSAAGTSRRAVLCLHGCRGDSLEYRLQRRGWTVRSVRTAAELLAIVDEEQPALIVLGLLIRGNLDGWSALRALRATPAGARARVVADYTCATLGQKGTALLAERGFDGAVYFPMIDPEQVSVLLRSLGLDD